MSYKNVDLSLKVTSITGLVVTVSGNARVYEDGSVVVNEDDLYWVMLEAEHYENNYYCPSLNEVFWK